MMGLKQSPTLLSAFVRDYRGIRFYLALQKSGWILLGNHQEP
jgi:hypothetical protein